MAIEVLRRSLFEKNDRAAEENRSLLSKHGVTVVNIMGGAGCGKTTLLERVIPGLRRTLRVAVLEGDLATTKDAARIEALGVPVIQLLTEGGCHLTATLVQQGLQRLPLAEIDCLHDRERRQPDLPRELRPRRARPHRGAERYRGRR